MKRRPLVPLSIPPFPPRLLVVRASLHVSDATAASIAANLEGFTRLLQRRWNEAIRAKFTVRRGVGA